MSGLELIAAVGVAASAVQLVDYGLKVIGTISETYSRVKDAQNRVARYTTQIHQIIEVGRAIQQNQALQSPLIHNQLQNTLTEVKQLHQVLGVIRLDYTTGSSTKRVWKAILGDNERRMLTCFERLEREKTALILCVVVVKTQPVQAIGNEVDALEERDMQKLFGKLNPKSKITKAETSTASTMSPDDRTAKTPKSNSGVPRDPLPSGPGSGKPRLHQPQNGSQTFNGETSTDESSQYNGDYQTGQNNQHSYQGQTSRDNSLQINGNTGSGGNHRHQNDISMGRSIQINGNVGSETTEEEIRQRSGRPLV